LAACGTLTCSDADRWVVITAGPEMGKGALLAPWLASRQSRSFGVASTGCSAPKLEGRT
jgi:hypothetical protein